MLISKTVKTVWNSFTKKWYTDKGYIYTKMKDEFEVKVEDLQIKSSVRVNVKCDCVDCKNPYLKPMKWVDYLNSDREDGKYYCNPCNSKFFNSQNISRGLLKKNGKSFSQWCIENSRQDILSRWDFKLNDSDPDKICFSANKRYWFKCPRNLHPSELKNINVFMNGHNGTMSCNACNSIAQYLIDNFGKNALHLYWSDKNILNPWEISGFAHILVWWKCLDGKHEDYCRNISNSNVSDFRCPECTQERRESILQEKVRLYLESLGYTILHEYGCTIIPQNPKICNKKGRMPFDNEIKELKLIIETHGKQHYEICSGKWLAKNFDFHKRQVYDRYKKYIANVREYNYLEIPYWTDNKKEEWKILINNKISKIITKQ